MNDAWDLVYWTYSAGFRLAARLLAQQACDSKTNQTFLIYPIVYLYRHHIKLALKAIIKSALGLLDLDLLEAHRDMLARHDLGKLWQTARPLLNPIYDIASSPPFPNDELEGVDSYVRQFDELDPDGQRFRYGSVKPKKAMGSDAVAPSLPANLKLDANVFASYAERFANYIDGLEWWLCDLEDAKAEFRRKQGESAGTA